MKRGTILPDGDIESDRDPKRPRSGDSAKVATAEPSRSRSAATTSRGSHHVRSRASTTSIQSATTQYIPDQHHGSGPEGYDSFSRPQFGTSQHQQHAYNGGNPEEMIMRFGEHLAHSNSQTNSSTLDPALHETSGSTRDRPDMSFEHSYHGHDNINRSFQSDMPPKGGVAGEASHAYANALFDVVDNHISDQLADDNDAPSEPGARKRKGTTSSIANDKELRRLLDQYDGYTLQEMALEVQKSEGAGGKSEKAKQVLAMIWLRENCERSGGSVRRDRVYCCYAEMCGTERTAVLNPASFGKLVRIIFPGVQTRRLGVRGESKYHYVDLSIIDRGPKSDLKGVEVPEKNALNASGEDAGTVEAQDRSTTTVEQQSTAGPSQPPTVSFLPSVLPLSGTGPGCCSDTPSSSHLNSGPRTHVRNMGAQERIRQLYFLNPAGLPAPAENSSLRLPDIHEYLPENTDTDVADALTALYRSHCISVIDSFRFCREKIMFRHFTAFQGTLTVPVHKLLVHPDVAPWVEECDWLMYQKMVAFVAPLYTQMIPNQVNKAFRNISKRLVPHIAETFKSHPEHVSAARLIPAGLFCRLLSRMLDANHAVNAASAWLGSIETRTQMWEDFSISVDVDDLMSKSALRPCCQVPKVLKIMEERFPLLLSPLRNDPPKSEPFQHGNGMPSFPSPPDQYAEFPDRWVEFMHELPVMFPTCTPHGLIEKIELLWTNALHRLTLSGSQTFSAWWMAKVFFIEAFHWQAEAGGFLAASPRSLRLLDSDHHLTELPNNHHSGETANSSSNASPNEQRHQANDAMDITTDGPTGASLPDKNHSANTQQPAGSEGTDRHMKDSTPNHDDSAIDLDDDSMLLSTGKFRDIMASDPADAEGDVVVV